MTVLGAKIAKLVSSLPAYPCGAMADAHEERIALTLPAIAGLEPGMSQEKRVAVMDCAIAKSRAAFIELNGDPFGCQVTPAATEEPSKAGQRRGLPQRASTA